MHIMSHLAQFINVQSGKRIRVKDLLRHAYIWRVGPYGCIFGTAFDPPFENYFAFFSEKQYQLLDWKFIPLFELFQKYIRSGTVFAIAFLYEHWKFGKCKEPKPQCLMPGLIENSNLENNRDPCLMPQTFPLRASSWGVFGYKPGTHVIWKSSRVEQRRYLLRRIAAVCACRASGVESWWKILFARALFMHWQYIQRTVPIAFFFQYSENRKHDDSLYSWNGV